LFLSKILQRAIGIVEETVFPEFSISKINLSSGIFVFFLN